MPWFTYIHTPMHTCIYIYIHVTYIYIYMCVCACVCVCVCVCACLCVFVCLCGGGEGKRGYCSTLTSKNLFRDTLQKAVKKLKGT